MARVIIRRDFAEEVIKQVNEKTEVLLDTISTLGTKLNEAKNVYNSDNSSGQSIDDMSATINKIVSSYSSLNRKFSQALRENIEEYSKSDQKVSSNVKAVASVPLAAGSAITNSPLTSNVANSAANANAKVFIDEKQLSKEYFEKEGNYTFEYRNDGSVKIDRDGEPLAFTTKETADSFLKSYGSSSSLSNKNNKTITAWSEGAQKNTNKTYETFEETAAYEAGKNYASNMNNHVYSLGVGATDIRDTDFQKKIEENNPYLYATADEEMIKAYERGIRDSSINATVANDTIRRARSSK